ncbi:hypothetical protein [Micromonospora sp. 067-2]|uniref:hypothetical protein n=1 Tax=Micromonospora sp. 067-2 TaxID=2789270 RepID=UPI003978C2A3
MVGLAAPALAAAAGPVAHRQVAPPARTVVAVTVADPRPPTGSTGVTFEVVSATPTGKPTSSPSAGPLPVTGVGPDAGRLLAFGAVLGGVGAVLVALGVRRRRDQLR